MNERLKSIVDLQKYPIYDLNSPIIKKLINKCKEELDQFSCSTIPNFILPKSLEIMNSELEKQLNEVYMAKESINPYLYAKDDHKVRHKRPQSGSIPQKVIINLVKVKSKRTEVLKSRLLFTWFFKGQHDQLISTGRRIHRVVDFNNLRLNRPPPLFRPLHWHA